MPIVLRKYQLDTIQRARESIAAGNKSIIIQASCGSGKTCMAAAICDNALTKNKKVLFLVHRRELAYQAAERFAEYGLGDEISIIMAGEESDLSKPIQIASIQSYIRRIKLNGGVDWLHKADIVVLDEAQVSISPTYLKVMENYNGNTIKIGLTATPCRGDSRPLGELYEDIVSSIGINELIELKHLVPVRYYAGKEKPDLSNISNVAGDFNKKELNKRMNKSVLIGDIFLNWARIAGDRSTIIFSSGVKHSKFIRDEFRRNGVTIEHIDSHTPAEERADVLKRLKNGDIQVITNCQILTEGFDFPAAGAICLCRPTRSYGLFVQMAGRGLRTSPGKQDCILIDFARNIEMHGFLTDEVSWSLSGKEKAWKKKKPRKKEAKIFECSECRAMHTGRCCNVCGHELKDYGKKIEVLEAELKEITRNGTKKKKPTMAEKRKFYQQLEYERRMKNFKPGWTYHAYLEKFQVAPHHSLRGLPPISPDASFNNYLQYKRIKWAKSKKKG